MNSASSSSVSESEVEVAGSSVSSVESSDSTTTCLIRLCLIDFPDFVFRSLAFSSCMRIVYVNGAIPECLYLNISLSISSGLVYHLWNRFHVGLFRLPLFVFSLAKSSDFLPQLLNLIRLMSACCQNPHTSINFFSGFRVDSRST